LLPACPTAVLPSAAEKALQRSQGIHSIVQINRYTLPPFTACIKSTQYLFPELTEKRCFQQVNFLDRQSASYRVDAIWCVSSAKLFQAVHFACGRNRHKEQLSQTMWFQTGTELSKFLFVNVSSKWTSCEFLVSF